MKPLSMHAHGILSSHRPELFEEFDLVELQPGMEAFHGLAGLVARSVAPHSEAESTTILLQFLTAFGNLIGSGPHCHAGLTRQSLNLFLVLVSKSGRAGEDTGWRQIMRLFAEVDPDWAAYGILTGRPSVHGILRTLCEQRGEGRRLFLLPEEFGSLLSSLTRENSTLAPLLRSAWDGGDLAGTGDDSSMRAFLAHVSLAGHLTEAELVPLLGRAEFHKGFCDRCLWASIRRSQFLPDDSLLPQHERAAIVERLHAVVDWIRTEGEVMFSRTPEGGQLWSQLYVNLAEGRADAHVLRLSALYAALDATPYIDTVHLRAALAVWSYCRSSSLRLFRRRRRFR
jgi:hypothetical protein